MILQAILARDSAAARTRVTAHLDYYEQRATRSLPELPTAPMGRM